MLNPRRLWATLPTSRINNTPVVAENIYIEAGVARTPDGPFEVFDDERNDADGTSSREGDRVRFDLTAARLAGALPEGRSFLAARAVEERPDLSSEEFPDGIDLLSAWSNSRPEVRVENPPEAPEGVAVEG